jgi:hypothetical protein
MPPAGRQPDFQDHPGDVAAVPRGDAFAGAEPLATIDRALAP